MSEVRNKAKQPDINMARKRRRKKRKKNKHFKYQAQSVFVGVNAIFNVALVSV